LFDLLRDEGLCLGGSSGINVAGAIRLARELRPGHTIVTILAHLGTRYQSKPWNPSFLPQKGPPVPSGLARARRGARARLDAHPRSREGDPMILGVHHPALAVPDLQRALDFYCGVLGFRVVMQAEIPSGVEPLDRAMGVSDAGCQVRMIRKGNSCIELF